jgi:hypothetical protein
VAGWRTGCGIIWNDTRFRFNVRDERYGSFVGLDAGAHDTLRCDNLFIECWSDADIKKYGFEFRRVTSAEFLGTSEEFFMFMQGGGTEIMFSSTWDYETRQGTGVTYAGCVEVHIIMVRDQIGNSPPIFEPRLEIVW